MSLAIISTHPIQYYAPIYRAIQAKFEIPVTAIYGSDFSIAGYRDKEFDAVFAWDTDLLSGYKVEFLSRVNKGGSRSLRKVLYEINPKAVLLTGYSPRFYRKAFYNALSGGYPILFRGDTTDHAKKRNLVKALVRDYFLRSIYKRCRKLLYVGQNSYKHFKRLGIPDEKL
ncbi:MAG: glycosyltransferase, partial [Candidatus Omnitrophica bacterium]|nr:glycosyltransferase [Candidatus Omnitrophota bacterium]